MQFLFEQKQIFEFHKWLKKGPCLGAVHTVANYHRKQLFRNESFWDLQRFYPGIRTYAPNEPACDENC